MDTDRVVVQTSKSQNCKRFFVKCMKKFLVFMISQVGLTGLMVGYAIAGGFIFVELESGHAKEIRSDISRIRSKQVNKLWNITIHLNILHAVNWSALAEHVFLEFQEEVYKATKYDGWDGQDKGGIVEEEWSYAGSLLYSVTVITTIGYGHLTPRTMWGRIVTMFYAIIGIPLFLLCLSNIGGLMAKTFRLFWKHLKYTQFFAPKNKRSPTPALNAQNRLLGSGGSGKDGAAAEPMNNDSGAFTISKELNRKPEMIRIPILVSLCMVALYIFLGAILFTYWERDWSMMDASYFCFVTLSTVGFGDLVPGYSQDSWGNQYKRIACTLYLLFGLALLAMCFELMQSEVKEICRRIARALGIVEDKTKGPQRV